MNTEKNLTAPTPFATPTPSSTPALRLKVLGARGSIPMEGEHFSIYGGATSCFVVNADDEEVYLDAGSAIVNVKPRPDSRITILLSHMHADHIIGLPFFSALSEPGRPIDIYARARTGLSPTDALDRLISPPIWPLRLNDYPANVTIHTLPPDDQFEPFFIGDVLVDTMEGTHPNGSTIYKLTRRGRSIVYATDFEHMFDDVCDRLVHFASDCDLLLYDAQYTPEEYCRCRGYGHSTAEVGLALAARARVSRLMFIHHAPNRTDRELADMQRHLSARSKNIIFAKHGDEISL